MKMEAVCSSKTLGGPTCKSTQHHNPQDHHRHLHCRENLRSQIQYEFTTMKVWCYMHQTPNYKVFLKGRKKENKKVGQFSVCP
jgi:hypothetical protein